MEKLSIDFEEVTRIFVKELRGKRSQESLSNDLESNFNIVNRWETGQRGFYWVDFLSLARFLDLEVNRALMRVIHLRFSDFPESSEILQSMLTPSAYPVLEGHFSTQKLNRLANGSTKLLFGDFLQIIELLYGRAERFLNHFLDEEGVRALTELFQGKEDYLKINSDDPSLALVRMVLDLKIYKDHLKHSDAHVAKIIGISEEEVAAKIKILESLGMISKSNDLYINNHDFVDLGTKGRAASNKTVNYWRARVGEANKIIEEPNPNVLSAYLLFTTNPALDEAVFEVCRKFYIDIKNLVATARPTEKENIRFLCVDLYYPLGRELPKTDA